MNSGHKPVRVGSRGSRLALWQTEAIIALLRAREPDLQAEIVQIVTHGDRFSQKPIGEMGSEVDKGIFNTALEDAVLAGEVDFCTGSFKDVQSDLRGNLRAVSVGQREDPRDVLVSRHGVPLAELPEGAVLATSSPRRISQLKAYRPDFRFQPLRGNVPTRVEREAGRFDGIVLAAAGLIRLGLTNHIRQYIGEDVLLPAPAQGAMGCEFLASNHKMRERIAGIQDAATERCVRAEKALLVRLSGGCFAPVGVLARIEGDTMTLRCRVASLDGTRVADATAAGTVAITTTAAGPEEEVEPLLASVEKDIAAQGGLEIVHEARASLQGGG